MSQVSKVKLVSATAYLIAIHVLIVLLVMKTDAYSILMRFLNVEHEHFEASIYYKQSIAYHKRQALSIDSHTTVLFGDSMLDGINHSLLGNAVNFSIGGDKSGTLKDRLTLYPEIGQANTIIFNIGINDLPSQAPLTIASNINQIMHFVAKKNQIWLGVLPITKMYAEEHKIDLGNLHALNKKIEQLCQTQRSCTYNRPPQKLLTRAGFLSPHHTTDGIHLNKSGYDIWTKSILSHVSLQQGTHE